MTLTADQISQTYEIFGIPQGGTAFVASKLISLFGPSGESYDFSIVITALNTKLAALTTNQITRVEVLLTRWLEINGFTPLRVSKGSSGAEGELVNYENERNNIRRLMGNLIGFACPEGGFIESLQAGQGNNRIIR